MALVEWKDEFKVGIGSVDYEHQQLIGLINNLHASLAGRPTKDAVGRVLGEIHTKIAAHFALEERVMRERRYDQYADHKADHERLLDEIRDIMDRHEADAYFNYETTLTKELGDWFGIHFRTKDARLHKAPGL
jgi:hemerythrin-like metal-binding protein